MTIYLFSDDPDNKSKNEQINFQLSQSRKIFMTKFLVIGKKKTLLCLATAQNIKH